MVFFGQNIILLFVAIGAVEWLTMARIVRGQVMSLKQQEFIEAARALGLRRRRIILRHIIPNLLGPIIVYATLTVPDVMLLEAFLSFLGLGVQPPHSSWGVLIKEGAEMMEEYPWLLLYPAPGHGADAVLASISSATACATPWTCAVPRIDMPLLTVNNLRTVVPHAQRRRARRQAASPSSSSAARPSASSANPAPANRSLLLAHGPAAAAAGARRRRRALCLTAMDLLACSRAATQPIPRTPHRHDFPGPDDLAQSLSDASGTN